MRTIAAAVCLLAAGANAEAGWLTANGRAAQSPRLMAFAGLRSAGLGYAYPATSASGDLSFEGSWSYADRFAQLSATRRWQLTRPGLASLCGVAGLAGYVVPEGGLDLGLGPHVGLFLALGGKTVSLHLGALSGADLFARGFGRFTERIQLAVTSQLGRLTLVLVARTGVDLIPGHNFVVTADVIVGAGLTLPGS